jgi:hypothetical protein
MVNATRTHAARQRKPLQPVNVTARFVGGATRQDVLDGSAVLSIATGDDTDRDESAYWTSAVYDGDRCVAFRLVKFGTGEQYDLPRDLSACDCPDHTYRSERPGGCKHMAALRQALPTVSRADPPAPVRPGPARKSERDDQGVHLAAEAAYSGDDEDDAA